MSNYQFFKKSVHFSYDFENLFIWLFPGKTVTIMIRLKIEFKKKVEMPFCEPRAQKCSYESEF